MFFYSVSCSSLEKQCIPPENFLAVPCCFWYLPEAEKCSVHSQELCFLLGIKTSLKWIPSHFKDFIFMQKVLLAGQVWEFGDGHICAVMERCHQRGAQI